MGKDLISVIVPVYNTEQYLKECLDSIINQTYKNIEIIIIDDGSTDNSLKIIKEYAENDGRIKYVSRENKGTLKTRIEGIKKAKGEFISFVDSDDWLELNAMNILYNKIVKHSADMVRASFKEVSQNEIIYYIKKQKETIYCQKSYEQVYDDLVSNSIFNSSCAQLVKREIYLKGIEKINSDIKMDEDQETNLHIVGICKKIILLPDIVYNYRRNDLSVSKKKDMKSIEAKINDLIFVYKDLVEFIQENKYENTKKAKERALKEINNFIIDLCDVKEVKREKKLDFLIKTFNCSFFSDILSSVHYNEINEDNIKKMLFIKNIYKNNYKEYLFNLRILKVYRLIKKSISKIKFKLNNKKEEKIIYSKI